MLESSLHGIMGKIGAMTQEELYALCTKLIRTIQVQHSALLVAEYSQESRISALKAKEAIEELLAK